MKLQEIVTRQEAIRAELLKFEQDAEGQDDATRSANMAWTDTLLEEYDTLEADRAPMAERMAKLDAVVYAARDERAVERSTPDLFIQQKRDPYENLDAVRKGLVSTTDLQARAFDAIERSAKHGKLNSDYAETATLRVEQDSFVARHILETGSDEYAENFRTYMANPVGMGQRTALALTPSANGGYLLPYVLDPTIVLTNSSSANPFRALGTVKQTSTNFWHGITSAGVNAAWLAEGTEVADNTPTVGPIDIQLYKAAAWVYGSYEVLAATDFANSVPRMFGDARDRLEEAAFAVGTGTAQPKGVVTAATTTVTTAGVGAFAIADLYSLTAAVPARFRANGKGAIVANLSQINRMRQFDTAGGASFWTNLGQGVPNTVLGLPIYESTSMAGTVTTGSKIAVAGDFSQYNIVDGIGMSLMYEPFIKGTNQRPTGQSGWFVYWQTGADVSTAAAFRTLVAG